MNRLLNNPLVWILYHWKTLWSWLSLRKNFLVKQPITIAIAMVMHYFHLVLEHGLPPIAWTWTTMPIQFFHAFTRGVKAWHAAHRNILPLPELSEWTLTHLQIPRLADIALTVLESQYRYLTNESGKPLYWRKVSAGLFTQACIE